MTELTSGLCNLPQQPFEARKGSHLRLRLFKYIPHPEVPRLRRLEGLAAASHTLLESSQGGDSAPTGRMRSLWVVLLLLLITPAHAVQPDEILKDPNLEARARHISIGLRCLVCQNQSIDESDAPVARDLRILIREQLTANKTDGEVMDFVVARYGDYVLLKPRFGAKTLALWLSPFILLLAGLAVFFRSGKSASKTDALSDTEKAELAALLRK